MCEFENYDKTSQVYDATRTPIGLEIIMGALSQNKIPLAEQRVLDAGCGTGNYLKALAPIVGRLHGVDQNDGMLGQAELKLSECHNVTLSKCRLQTLDQSADTYDGVLMNQVLHHISSSADMVSSNYKEIRKAIASAHTVLAANGAVIINISTPNQQRHGFWWASLIPNAVENIVRRYIELDVLIEILNDAGFKRISSIVPLTAVLQGKSYFDPMGPLYQAWRNGDSTWSLATHEELHKAQEIVRSGNATEYLLQHDAQRHIIGQTTFLYAYK